LLLVDRAEPGRIMANREGESNRGFNRHSRPAPKWASGLLAAALPIAVALELLALVFTVMVFPLFDLVPVFVLVVTLVSRRWDGVSAKWFKISAILAGVMLLEWIAWGSWYIYAVVAESVSVYRFDEVVLQFGNLFVVVMAAETIALLFAFGVASVTSLKGVKKSRMTVAAEQKRDAPVIS